MKEKLKQLKDKMSELAEKTEFCEHEWGDPVYDPDLFDGIDRWSYTCIHCGKKEISYSAPRHENSMSR